MEGGQRQELMDETDGVCRQEQVASRPTSVTGLEEPTFTGVVGPATATETSASTSLLSYLMNNQVHYPPSAQ